MKKFLAVLLIFSVVLLCGFKRKTRPIIILSSNKIISENIKETENNFLGGTRIYYALYSKDGFRGNGIRLQISKQDEKVSNWGFSIVSAKDIYVDSKQKVYRDYIYLTQKGHYIIQFFYLNNRDYPFAHREFRVY